MLFLCIPVRTGYFVRTIGQFQLHLQIAVGAFLSGRIRFTDIYDVVTESFEKMTEARREAELSGIIAADREARRIAEGLVLGKQK